jgi:hypothetical protein
MLDMRNTALGSRHFHSEGTNTSPDVVTWALPSIITISEEDASGVPTPHPGYIELPPSKTRVSLQDMITTSIALRSNLEVDIESPSSAWSTLLFPPGSSSPTKSSLSLPPESVGGDEGAQLPSHVAEAISSLQREVLLLRNELNFELWLSRENVQHIGRLHQDRILSKSAEVERQGLVRLLVLFLPATC